MKKLFLFIIFILITQNSYSQFSSDVMPQLLKGTNCTTKSDVQISKKPGHYTCEQWRHLIDSIWGQGPSTTTKLQIFDIAWGIIDTGYACFNNYPVNWDSIKNVYRPEIAAGVSYGRFTAILNYMAFSLHEGHTAIGGIVNFPTKISAGLPILNIGAWGDLGHFGAGLSPLPDSSLLVYSVVTSHPLGLQVGDIVLGYDRVPWRVLIRELIACEIPFLGSPFKGSSPSSFNYSLLNSAGENWHLYDTIDVVKYLTGDTVHLSTFPLRNQTMSLYCTDQMSIQGVPKPVGNNECSYGIVQGTNIGYIYIWGWNTSTVEQQFKNAVQSLMNTDGLIIDFRYVLGGNMFASNPGLELLFDESFLTIDASDRCSPSNHFELCPQHEESEYVIPSQSPGYKKPIAVLTGPACISSGDQVALRFKYHPYARFFGKSTNTAFNGGRYATPGPGFSMFYAELECYQVPDTSSFLTHKEFDVDYDVWLTQAGVVQGKDDVVEAALQWIDTTTIGITKTGTEIPLSYKLEQNYPNPFNPVTKIRFSVPPNSDIVSLTIYDNLGRKVTTLLNSKLSPGNYETTWDGTNNASGVYLYVLESGNIKETKKMILLK